MPELTAGQVAAWTGGSLVQGNPATPVRGVAWDSRLTRPGQCFVALSGARVDGHDYVAAALAAGAACALVSRPVPAPPAAPLVRVGDPLLALGSLAAAWRQQFSARVVGITGSVGKTTTKELCAAVLATRFHTMKSPGNLNSEVGLPAALLNHLDADVEAAVVEMGMRAPGEIRYLAAIARPQVAVVTNVGATHLEVLGSVDNIARAKGELVEAVPASGWAVLNADDPRVLAMQGRCAGAVIFCAADGDRARAAAAGRPGSRAVWLDGWQGAGEAGQSFTLYLGSAEHSAAVWLPAPGRHLAQGALAAAGAGWALGLGPEEIARGIAAYEPAGNRMRVCHRGGVRLIDDTYNAAPASMAAALTVLCDLAGRGRRVAVLGDMFELGAAAEEGHRAVGAAAAAVAHLLVAVGDRARWYVEAALTAGMAREAAHYFTDRAAAAAFVCSAVRTGDTVLFKGSRGMRMEELVAALERRLPEAPRGPGLEDGP